MARRWKARVTIKQLITEDESHQAVQAEMTAIADVLAQSNLFNDLDLAAFYEIPEGDAVFGPVDYANRLLHKIYDHADHHRIWIA